MYTSLVTEDTCLHIGQVVCLALLECLRVSLLLHLLGFQEITRIVFVRQGYWYDVQFLQAVDNIAFPSHSQHLQYAVLCTVVGVFRTAFTLCNPHILLLLCYGKMNVP